MWVLCGLAATASAAEITRDSSPSAAGDKPVADASHGDPIDFQIPAQPLGDALDRYAAISGRTVLFRSELVAGRSSSAVVGRYRVEAALDLLLAHTGLAVKKSSAGLDAFVLDEMDSIASAAASTASYDGIDGLVSDRRYPGGVQARIWQALCGNRQTVPGSYRSLLRFRLDTAGRLRNVHLLESSGDVHRDDAIVNTLDSLHVDPPPIDVADQALTMLIEPMNRGPNCGREAGTP